MGRSAAHFNAFYFRTTTTTRFVFALVNQKLISITTLLAGGVAKVAGGGAAQFHRFR
jgi:hypothetical protein